MRSGSELFLARRPSHRQAAFAQIEFATDSPLEEDGFELPVRGRIRGGGVRAARRQGCTKGAITRGRLPKRTRSAADGLKVRMTPRWREMDSNFRFRGRWKRGLRRKSPASAACRRRFCGCRRWPSAQAQSEISEPNPYRARNRKFESNSLPQRFLNGGTASGYDPP